MHAEGIIYNDIKTEHIFWDPRRARVTIIDWGNTQLAEHNGMSHDRQFSTQGDFRQFIEEMGRYLSSVAPDLRTSLGWPAQFEPDEDPFLPGGLYDRIKSVSDNENERLISDPTTPGEAAPTRECQRRRPAAAGGSPEGPPRSW